MRKAFATLLVLYFCSLSLSVSAESYSNVNDHNIVVVEVDTGVVLHEEEVEEGDIWEEITLDKTDFIEVKEIDLDETKVQKVATSPDSVKYIFHTATAKPQEELLKEERVVSNYYKTSSSQSGEDEPFVPSSYARETLDQGHDALPQIKHAHNKSVSQARFEDASSPVTNESNGFNKEERDYNESALRLIKELETNEKVETNYLQKRRVEPQELQPEKPLVDNFIVQDNQPSQKDLKDSTTQFISAPALAAKNDLQVGQRAEFHNIRTRKVVAESMRVDVREAPQFKENPVSNSFETSSDSDGVYLSSGYKQVDNNSTDEITDYDNSLTNLSSEPKELQEYSENNGEDLIASENLTVEGPLNEEALLNRGRPIYEETKDLETFQGNNSLPRETALETKDNNFRVGEAYVATSSDAAYFDSPLDDYSRGEAINNSKESSMSQELLYQNYGNVGIENGSGVNDLDSENISQSEFVDLDSPAPAFVDNIQEAYETENRDLDVETLDIVQNNVSFKETSLQSSENLDLVSNSSEQVVENVTRERADVSPIVSNIQSRTVSVEEEGLTNTQTVALEREVVRLETEAHNVSNSKVVADDFQKEGSFVNNQNLQYSRPTKLNALNTQKVEAEIADLKEREEGFQEQLFVNKVSAEEDDERPVAAMYEYQKDEKIRQIVQPAQNNVSFQPGDPFKIIEELKNPNNQPAETKFLSGEDDPIGENLEQELPISTRLSKRFEEDILDPIELDLDRENVVDLDLQKALMISLRSNLPQRIIDETVLRDKWRFFGNVSGLLPDASLSYTFQDQPSGVSQFSGTSHRNQLAISYNFAPSEVFSTFAAYYDWMANSAFSGDNVQALLRTTTNQYYDLMRARGELAVRIEAVKQAKVQLTLNERLESAGVGTRFSVLQSREQLAENELAFLSQQSAVRIVEIQLLSTLNMPLDTDITLAEQKILRRPLVSPELGIDDLVNLARQKRPNIKRRQLAARAAKHRVTESVLDAFVPALDVEYTNFRFERRLSDSLNATSGNIKDRNAFILQLDIPVLKGLGLGQASPINENRAVSRQALLELENEILTVNGEVRDAFLRSQSSNRRIDASERQLAAATEGIKLARIRLANGVGTNIDLIDTQRNYVNALINKVRALTEYNQAQVDILRSIGEISLTGIVNRDFAFGGQAPRVAQYNSPVNEEEEEFETAGVSN
ncbi:MAG TPA: TolC family protein [Vampirovibrionales bacterium]